MMIHQTCFLLSLSLGLYEDGSFLHRLETQLPPKPPAPFLCLKFPIGLPSSNTLRIRLKFLHFFPIFPLLSRPQQAAPECTGVAALGVGSSRTCRHSLLSLISGGGTARRRGWHGAAERLHAGPIRVLASTCMSFLMWDKLLSWP